MPIFYSNCMIWEVICGLILLGEAERYSTSHLVGISIGVIVTVLGIFVLGGKKAQIAIEDEKERQMKRNRLSGRPV